VLTQTKRRGVQRKIERFLLW